MSKMVKFSETVEFRPVRAKVDYFKKMNFSCTRKFVVPSQKKYRISLFVRRDVPLLLPKFFCHDKFHTITNANIPLYVGILFLHRNSLPVQNCNQNALFTASGIHQHNYDIHTGIYFRLAAYM